jgi:hypothetical protein
MDNVEFYKCAKFQLEISCNGICAKITKSNTYSSEQVDFQNLKIYQILSFLWSLGYKVFGIETFHDDKTQHFPHLEFLHNFLKLLNSIFKF